MNKMHREILVILPVLLVASLAASSCSNVGQDKFRVKDTRSEKYHCVQAQTEGEWSHGWLPLGKTTLEPGKVTQHDVKISCWGFYDLFLSVTPNNNVSVVANENGRNAYVEIIRSADGAIRERYLKPHNIRYAVTLTSLTNPKRTVSENESWTRPTFPSTMPSIPIIIPIHFRRNEMFRISVEIEAEPDFYEDYKWLSVAIALPIH